MFKHERRYGEKNNYIKSDGLNMANPTGVQTLRFLEVKKRKTLKNLNIIPCDHVS